MIDIIYKNKVLFIIINLIIFFINIYIFTIMNKDKSQKLSVFKEVDINIFNIASKSFSEISKYLNIKYVTKRNNNYNKKIIKFYYVDFESFFNIKRLIRYDSLKDKYIFEIDSNNPDYLFYGSTGREHLSKINL